MVNLGPSWNWMDDLEARALSTPPNPASPRPPRGGSGQSQGEVMGYQPTSQGHYRDDIDVIYKLNKEVEQLQVANNELTAELYRYQERERLEITGDDQLARNLETAEDHLWHSQDQLALEKAYTKGFATVAVVSAPATVVLLLWTAGVEGGLLTTFGVIFTVVFGLAALLGIAVTLAKLFGQLPEAKRLVKRNQLVLDRAQMRKMGL